MHVIDLFAGAGGLSLGMDQAGLEHVLLVENDKDAVATLRENRSWKVAHADIHDVSFRDIQADVVIGGPPCQSFSFAGKRLGLEDLRGTLFREYVRCIEEVKPSLFLFENVAGLPSHNKGQTLEVILAAFDELGYRLQWRVLNAVNYEVPQRRQRFILVGTRPGIEFQFPDECDRILTLKDALIGVPSSPGVMYSEVKRRVLELVPSGGNWRDLPEYLAREYMCATYFSGGGKTGVARRLSWDEPSLTIMTSQGQKVTERCHPSETRPLTVRESARIQTFPDDWCFKGGIGSQYRQIGNAVPVKFAYFLGKQIVKALDFSIAQIAA
jgi:DNA (cytosine-5)-methyltransferase 1